MASHRGGQVFFGVKTPYPGAVEVVRGGAQQDEAEGCAHEGTRLDRVPAVPAWRIAQAWLDSRCQGRRSDESPKARGPLTRTRNVLRNSNASLLPDPISWHRSVPLLLGDPTPIYVRMLQLRSCRVVPGSRKPAEPVTPVP